MFYNALKILCAPLVLFASLWQDLTFATKAQSSHKEVHQLPKICPAV
jgi:hypothetical protein